MKIIPDIHAMEKEGIWSEKFKVLAFMVDKDRALTFPMLCNLLQEVAGNHANFRKLGFFDMQSKNRFWVLNRLKLSINDFPKWQDEIEVQTWVSLMKGPFSNRHFSVLKEGKEIASAFTFWVAIDADTHKPVRINSEDVVVLENNEASCGPAEKLMQVSDGEMAETYTVKNSDLDMIGHVNNVKYIEWILNQVEEPTAIKTIEANFLKETHLADTVEILNKGNDYLIQSKSDKVPVFVLRINKE